jgi:hypothetical protein
MLPVESVGNTPKYRRIRSSYDTPVEGRGLRIYDLYCTVVHRTRALVVVTRNHHDPEATIWNRRI